MKVYLIMSDGPISSHLGMRANYRWQYIVPVKNYGLAFLFHVVCDRFGRKQENLLVRSQDY